MKLKKIILIMMMKMEVTLMKMKLKKIILMMMMMMKIEVTLMKTIEWR